MSSKFRAVDDDALHRVAARTKKAHPIWALRPDDAPDDAADGYQLVRLHEEPAADLRRTASKCAAPDQRPKTPEQEAERLDVLIEDTQNPHLKEELNLIHDRLLKSSTLIKGMRVLAVHKGVLAQAVVVNINVADETLDVEHADGTQDLGLPVEFIVIDEARDPFDVVVTPT